MTVIGIVKCRLASGWHC